MVMRAARLAVLALVPPIGGGADWNADLPVSVEEGTTYEPIDMPRPMSFRLGSGAVGADVVNIHGLTAAEDNQLPVNKKLKPMPIAHRMLYVTRWMHPIFIMFCIIMMMPSGGSSFSQEIENRLTRGSFQARCQSISSVELFGFALPSVGSE